MGIDEAPHTEATPESELAAGYGPCYKEHLLEQYKVFVASADAVSDRRARANSFLLTINAGLVALFGTTMESFPWYTSFLIALGGLLVALTWLSLLESYRTLNTAKFKVIHQMEQDLPIRAFDIEWKLLGEGQKGHHRPLTSVEKVVPWVFVGVYAILMILVAVSPFVSD